MLSTDDELDKKAAALADKEQFNVLILALGASYDPKTGDVSLPTLSDFVPTIRDLSAKTTQRDNAESSLQSIAETMNESAHYLARNVDPPIFSKITLVQVSQDKWSTAIVDSLDAKSSTVLSYC